MITLNTNEIYSFFSNMIIFQQIMAPGTAEPTLAEACRKPGGMYGDKMLFYAMDAIVPRDWEGDAEAPRVLDLHRHQRGNTQEVDIDTFKVVQLTVDAFLTKRAWMRADSFSTFNGLLLGLVAGAKRIYDNGLVNVAVGTYVSSAPAANVTVDVSGFTVVGAADAEAVARLRGQMISKAIADVFVGLKDNRRDFNELDYLTSYTPEELTMVWNAEMKNQILHIDLPTVYHQDGVRPMRGIDVPGRYFGTPIATAGTVPTGNTTIRSNKVFIPATVTDGKGIYFGDLLPDGYAYGAGEAYTEDPNCIGMLLSKEGVIFASAMSVGRVYQNALSLTDTHNLVWGYGLGFLKYKPFVRFTLNP